MNAKDADPIDLAVGLHTEAMDAHDRGDAPAAKRLSARAVALLERHAGRDHPDTANARNLLSKLHLEEMDHRTAERLARASVAGLRRCRRSGTSPDIDRIYVQSLQALGAAIRVSARYAAAYAQMKRTLAVAKRLLGPRDPDVASCLNDLGMLCKYWGRFPEGRRWYAKSLALTIETSGPDSSETATLYHNLAGIEHTAQNFAAAVEPGRRSVEVREKALGRGHPAWAADVAQLGAILDAVGETSEAEHCYREAIGVFRKHHGRDHYEVGFNYGNLATLKAGQGKLREAKRLYERGLAIMERALGRQHPETALFRQNLGTVLRDLGDRAGARRLIAASHKVLLAKLGAAHPNTRACKSNLDGLRARPAR